MLLGRHMHKSGRDDLHCGHGIWSPLTVGLRKILARLGFTVFQAAKLKRALTDYNIPGNL
jgi:hypothetical protein